MSDQPISSVARADVPDLRAPDADVFWNALRQAARAPYRSSGRFAWYFAEGKLSRDPVFRSLLECGDIAANARVLDIGCGQGLLASLLAAADAPLVVQRWPAQWQPAPVATRYTGLELMPRDVARAQQALGGLATQPLFVCADMCTAALPASDVVVILDVLHYVDWPAQEELLRRVRDALVPRGRLLLRIGDNARRRAFASSQWVDRLVTGLRGHRIAPTFGRSLDQWLALLAQLGFSVTSVPMSRGTPFANVLLRADLA